MASYERTNYLAHHGVKGQKWGIRRFQNQDGTLTTAGKDRYSASDYTRQLNRVDTQVSRQIYKSERAGKKLKKLENKVKEAEATGKLTDKKAKKIAAKAQRLIDKQKEANRLTKEGESVMWKTMGDAINSGYSISSTAITKDVNYGRHVMSYVLAGPIGAMAASAISYTTAPTRSERAARGFIETAAYAVKRPVDGKPSANLSVRG